MLLVTRPNHDLITNYLYYWTNLLLEEASKRNLPTIDLDGNKANAKQLSSRISKQKPQLVLLNGHGNEETITGYDNEPIVTMSTASILSGSLVYARSCSSGSKLGYQAVVSGARGFIGYKESFIMCFDKDKVQHPLGDDIAAKFLEPSNQVMRSLMKGHTLEDASARSRDLSKKYMQGLITSNATSEDMAYARYIWHNMRSQVCIGDQQATIT